MAVTGPDFISLQVRDLERSAAFYEQYLGLKRSDAGPPHAVVFATKPIAFAVRDVVAGVDLDAIAQPGQGMALWLHAPDAQDIHDALAAAGATIVSAPVDGPFGRTFTFADPDGYQVTLHDRGLLHDFPEPGRFHPVSVFKPSRTLFRIKALQLARIYPAPPGMALSLVQLPRGFRQRPASAAPPSGASVGRMTG